MIITKALLKHIKQQNHAELDKLLLEEPKSVSRLDTLLKSGYVIQVDDDFEITGRGMDLFDKLL